VYFTYILNRLLVRFKNCYYFLALHCVVVDFFNVPSPSYALFCCPAQKNLFDFQSFWLLDEMAPKTSTESDESSYSNAKMNVSLACT